MKKLLVIFTTMTLILTTSCSSATLESVKNEVNEAALQVLDADNEFVAMVKGGYNSDNPDVTYQEAFESFFGSPKWIYGTTEDGKQVVQFTGDCTYQDTPVKATIQFVLDVENGTFQAEHLAFNDVPQAEALLYSLMEKAFSEYVPSEADNAIVGSTAENSTVKEEVAEKAKEGLSSIAQEVKKELGTITQEAKGTVENNTSQETQDSGFSVENPYGTVTYTGAIDAYPIHMTINFNGGVVDGTYYYDEYGTEIPFAGNFDGSNLMLYVTEEGYEEVFMGVLDGEGYYGTWYNPNSTFDFSLGVE